MSWPCWQSRTLQDITLPDADVSSSNLHLPMLTVRIRFTVVVTLCSMMLVCWCRKGQLRARSCACYRTSVECKPCPAKQRCQQGHAELEDDRQEHSLPGYQLHTHLQIMASPTLRWSPSEVCMCCSFRPHVMTALMGTTGAGKTTLMDLLACRKNSKPSLLSPRLHPYRSRHSAAARVHICITPALHGPDIIIMQLAGERERYA